MGFMDVLSALDVIKRHCQETVMCENCRLHKKNEPSTCGVSPKGYIPANWEFDLESEETVPSIFK